MFRYFDRISMQCPRLGNGLIPPVTVTALSWGYLGEGSSEIDSKFNSLLGGGFDDYKEIGNALSRLG